MQKHFRIPGRLALKVVELGFDLPTVLRRAGLTRDLSTRRPSLFLRVNSSGSGAPSKWAIMTASRRFPEGNVVGVNLLMLTFYPRPRGVESADSIEIEEEDDDEAEHPVREVVEPVEVDVRHTCIVFKASDRGAPESSLRSPKTVCLSSVFIPLLQHRLFFGHCQVRQCARLSSRSPWAWFQGSTHLAA